MIDILLIYIYIYVGLSQTWYQKNNKFNGEHHSQPSDFRVVSYHVFVMQVIVGNLPAISGYIASHQRKPDFGPLNKNDGYLP